MKKMIPALLLTLGVASSGGAMAAAAEMWREPIPVIKEGKYYSLIVDRGELHKAMKSSKNEYLFSEKGAGVKPLVLIGTPVEITEFLLKNETRGIENEIAELPEIYMGITKYVPRKRFTGLFPLNDLLITAVEQAQKFLPFGTIITDAAGVPGDLKALYDSLEKLQQTQKASGQILYVKFSYLPEDGMTQIGSKTISFGKILKIMQNKS
ncbi:hypothetical protein N5923_02405 [Erwiniaceae bacterium BAC15a-03b]|uniref:Uncharacterized protein n=1 Tax=Winslowiella arboricola TaxID=2978220 RepID=A0A9J6PI27_9GAMM|nr:hypothetical protein [Winslowiella arboricola]MCU5771541.1 hypothetical protein [Winslowiella arboricola]MCU5776350.1 hypothetical protein [Winslowiella arboricola]